MFLCNHLLDFVFPPYCLFCKDLLQSNHHLCALCQETLSHAFENAPVPFKYSGDWICPIFEASRQLQLLLNKIELPVFSYLNRSLASLVIIKMIRYQLPWPGKVQNPFWTLNFFTSRELQIPKELSSFFKNKNHSTYTLVYLSSQKELERAKKKKFYSKKRNGDRIWVIEQY